MRRLTASRFGFLAAIYILTTLCHSQNNIGLAAGIKRPISLRGKTSSHLTQTVSSNGKPSLAAFRVEKGPTVDGRLDDAVWNQAPIGGPLYEYVPKSELPMTELTEFRVIYNKDYLYVGVWCYDSDPSKINARIMERDASIFSDDNVQVVIDTFHDNRNGYIFMTNPNGARRDELISNNVQRNVNWDGVWTVRCRIDQDGWKIEMAIPFKTLSFDPTSSVWGFNLTRSISRKSERGRWSGARPEVRSSNVAEAGDLIGLNGMRQGIGLEVTPYVLGRYSRMDEPSDTDRFGEFGGEVRYRITPNLSTTISYNTDFAETEVDQRQINLTRFPLFFPEKRDFFLEDSGIFEFGGLGSGISLRPRSVFRSPLIPFFTRRIGRSDKGRIVPILGAGKVAGRVGNYNIGFQDAVLDHEDLGIQNAFSGRVSRNMFEQSTLGMIATAGDPNSKNENFLIGPDFQYRTSKFMGNQILEASLFTLGTYTENAEEELAMAYGGNIAYPNDLVRAQIEFMGIDEAFNPGLGFVRRKDTLAYGSLWSFEPRPESIEWARQFKFTYQNSIFTNPSNKKESVRHEFTPLQLELDSADEIFIKLGREFDRPRGPFEIVDGVFIPEGAYWWTDFGIGIESASNRLIQGEVEFTIGEFYTGDRQQIKTELELLPWKRLNLLLEYDYNHVDLPLAEFHVHIAAFRMVWNFTPDLIWSHLVQYDNLSDSVGLNSRLRWEYRSGSQLFLVANQSYLREDNSVRVLDTELNLKVGATIRF